MPGEKNYMRAELLMYAVMIFMILMYVTFLPEK